MLNLATATVVGWIRRRRTAVLYDMRPSQKVTQGRAQVNWGRRDDEESEDAQETYGTMQITRVGRPTVCVGSNERLSAALDDVIPIAQGMGADASALESCTSHMVWLGGQREKAVETRPGANMKVAAAWTLEEQTSPFFEHFLKECWPCEDPLLVFTRKTTVEGRRFKLLSGSHIAKRTLLSNTGLTTAVFCDEYGIAAKHDRKNG
uniref:Retrotransposon hot spot (RHS) protein n=1 Tax=Panagrellus redivivus TaxID=6233 RepID=A0A7E4VTN1_PANRE